MILPCPTGPLDTQALENQVIACLKGVFDPEIPVNIHDLGLIYGIDITPSTLPHTYEVRIQMTLTSPACPVAQTFPQTVQEAIGKVPNIAHVSVELVWDPPWTRDRMSEVAKLELNML